MDVDERSRSQHAEGDEEHPRQLRAISLLPSAATLGNLLCGFVAIFCCAFAIRGHYYADAPMPKSHYLAVMFPTYVSVGAYLVVAAMIFDALDGRLARIARRTSEFGAQLDSIADIVSFGTAPAALFLTMLLPMAYDPAGDPPVSRLLWRLALLGALVYVSCAAIRLARYNAENIKDATAKKEFTGLPVPGAAAALVGLLALHEDIVASGAVALGVDWSVVMRWAIGPIALALGLLMISRLNFLHVFNVYFRRNHPPSHLVAGLIIVALGLYWPQMLLVVLAYLYVFSGLVQNLVWRRRRWSIVGVQRSTREPSHVDEN